jgi:hypothetical protein
MSSDDDALFDEDDLWELYKGGVAAGFTTTVWDNFIEAQMVCPDNRPRKKLAPGCYHIKPIWLED